MEKEAILVGTSRGLLLLHSVDDNASQVVGGVDGGVKCISASPDGDLLAILSGSGQILVMTLDWDLLYETALEDLPEDDVNHVCKDLFSSLQHYLWIFRFRFCFGASACCLFGNRNVIRDNL